MKQYIMVLIIWLLGIMVCTGAGPGAPVRETGSETEQGEEEIKAAGDAFVKQLFELIAGMLKEKDEQKLSEIKSRFHQLVRGNLYLIVKIVNILLADGVRSELKGDTERGKAIFMIGMFIAGIYKNEAGDSYLTDKVALFRRWQKEEKKKYLEAEKFYSQFEETVKKYSDKTAVAAYNRGLALYQEIGYKEGEAKMLKRLGDMHYQLDENEQARDRYEQGLAIFRRIKDWLGEANTLQSLGDVYYQLDDYEQARDRYEQGLAIFRKLKEFLSKANILLRLGYMHFLLSENEQARERYNQALVIYRRIKYRLGEANTLTKLGDLHGVLSEYEQAWERHEQALAIYRQIKYRFGEANTLLRLGAVHEVLSEYEQTREMYEQGLNIYRQIKSRLGEANTLRSLGGVHMILSEYEQARERYEKSLAIYRQIKSRLGEANTLTNLGDVHYQLKEHKKARERYEQALTIYQWIKARSGEAHTLQRLGNMHWVIKEYEKAGRCYQQALTLQKNIGERTGMAWSYYYMGKTHEAANNFTMAEKQYINSIETIEAVWGEMKREDFKAPYLTSKIYPYEDIIHLLFKQDKGKQALEYAERSKARSFLYLLGNHRIDIKKGVPLHLVRQEEELRLKIASLTRKIMENEKKEYTRRSPSAPLIKELDQLKQTHGQVLQKMKFLCPEYADMKSITPLTPKEIQTQIRETGETVFLEYYTTPGAVFLWVLDGHDIFPYQIDIDNQTLQKKVREYYRMISLPDVFGPATLENQARELYNLLLGPAEKHWTGKTRAGIIPHGILHYLPFAALMKDGKFLMERDKVFFYLPSASIYKYCREKNPLKKEQLIALGNPDGSLVFSEKEVRELKELYPRDTEIFTGKQATETRARYYGPYADILHFSCHGGFVAANPLYSALELAPDIGSDGRLEVQEIFQLKLKPAYLVTLSACETHVSEIRPGDEMVGLSRAFIYAGTPSVLASLWKVDDYYTEKLMVSFYRALKTPGTTDKLTALHQARQEMIKTYGKRHPFYWAPFVLMGDFR